MTRIPGGSYVGAIFRALISLPVLVALAQAASPHNQGGQPSGPLLYAFEEQAMKAYDDKHYAESAHLFDAAFSTGLDLPDDATTPHAPPRSRAAGPRRWIILNGQHGQVSATPTT
ncbi:MAG TPA: hypothetical protein VG206_27345 [Terriglobia bacterium]|nr:hypothetical protein [Terriglobia bacterium]